MSIREINKKILAFGIGLLAKIQYEMSFSYSDYDFLKLRHLRRRHLNQKISHSIYKKKV